MKQKILIVDDEKSNINILVDLLQSDYILSVAKNGRQCLKIALSDQKPDLILLDVMMPEMDGYEVCAHLKADKQTKDIPIIFITAKTQEDDIEKAYNVGGNDYVTKPFKPKELISRIKKELKITSLIKHLENLSSYDQLTKVFNRRKFFELSQDVIDSKNDVHVAMLDIDKFKSINDNYGHPVGDKVLQEVAKQASDALLQNSIFARLGGEEFAVVYFEVSKDEAEQNLQTLRKSIEALQIEIDNTEHIGVTISGGMVSNAGQNKDLDKLLLQADEALYEAKESGRNKIILV